MILTIINFIFWFSIGLIFYSYIGYGMLVWVLVRIKKMFAKQPVARAEEEYPMVALVVAAYNEQDFIEQKIANSLQLDYPKHRLELIFITDGSNDLTPEIIRKYPEITLMHSPERRGKSAAMNRAIRQVSAPYVIFCDANTLLNKECVKMIVRHYADPRVGGVAGEKRIWQNSADAAAAAGEGLYWKYESYLKKLDSDLYTTVGAAGELFSVRKDLFEAAPEGTIIEDFVQSLKLCVNGYVVRYEPQAYAAEAPSASIKEEMKRKVRICAGAFQAMILLKPLFNIFRYPVVSFQFISHRILRWTLCPVALITTLLSNIAIVFLAPTTFYVGVLFLQSLFYMLGITGWIFASRNIRLKAVYIPFYFLFMNISVFMGFSRFVKKKQTVLWEKAARSQSHA
ncbi:glycosyltransferase family 2 protein [Pseudoflavitalea sp. G-6-1-2]|uniref:glycosyltransferase family 2 protein n=1 Tax=Pseudoflavitalea sp. G-6-1-2 TaxID=2728841 RepID=UPI00146BDB4D|nr:glycosyltransferase family 2 protein [Pseudoflavitalea sp. G-6-1-2]NML19338.1 glycosyltransferase family 2 protein [Pseudoflavitalea sp. G-6-1-2]